MPGRQGLLSPGSLTGSLDQVHAMLLLVTGKIYMYSKIYILYLFTHTHTYIFIYIIHIMFDL